MIGFETSLGTVEIAQEYLVGLISRAASECYGVAGMIDFPRQDIRSRLTRRDDFHKGVRVSYNDGQLTVHLRIAVTYGVNISAIVRSIVHKVRYTVEDATGLPVAKVTVHVVSMKAQ